MSSSSGHVSAEVHAYVKQHVAQRESDLKIWPLVVLNIALILLITWGVVSLLFFAPDSMTSAEKLALVLVYSAGLGIAVGLLQSVRASSRHAQEYLDNFRAIRSSAGARTGIAPEDP